MHMHGFRAQRDSAGFALLEALVAMLVLAFGMLALAGFQTTLSRNSDIAKQRTEATRLAQRQIDTMRSFVQRQADGDPATNPGSTNLTYVEDVVTRDPYTVTSAMTNASFSVATTAVPADGDRFRWVRVLVTWNDRTGASQNVNFSTAISDGDPGDLGVIGVGRGRSATLRPRNRNVNIPYPAVTLSGGQRSAFIPPPGNVIFVFDNSTGQVVQRCTGLPVALTAGIDIVAAGGICTDLNAYLLSGYVRFKTGGAAPSAANIDDQGDLTDPTLPLLPTNLVAIPATQPLTIDSAATGNAPSNYECYSQRQLTVRSNATGSELTINEGSAVPAGYSASNAPRFIAYTCIVTPTDHDSNPTTPSIWSGELRLNADSTLPVGLAWAFGTWNGGHKACRYTSDYNRNSALSNHEHPRYYRHVSGAIDNQNFLVINSNDNCPTDIASNPVAGDLVDTNTATHQPESIAVLSFRCLNAACNGSNRVVTESATPTTALPME